MSRFRHIQAGTEALDEALDLAGLSVTLRVQLLRLFAMIILTGLIFGTLVGFKAAGVNQQTVLVQLSTDPDDLVVAAMPPGVLGLRPGLPDTDADTEIVEISAPGKPLASVFSASEAPAETFMSASIEPALHQSPVSDKPITAGHMPPKDRIILIIDDLGLHPARARQLADMPVKMTLAWLPYASNLEAQSRYAFERGHEIFAHVPMEPSGDENPGPAALMTWHSKDEIRGLLDGQLDSIVGLTGLNNHMGSKFTTNRMSLTWLMAAVKDRDLLFVDSVTVPGSIAATVAREHGLPFLQRDFFIDHEAKGNPALIQRRLAQLEELAHERGEVVAIGHPYEVTVSALSHWLPEAQSRNLEFITVSQSRSVGAGANKTISLSMQ